MHRRKHPQDYTDAWESLVTSDGGRIVYLVLDGLGGLAKNENGATELQAAATPHLDALAQESSCGLLEPVGPGITPGSGPGHLALFGYHPLQYELGRGILSALGIDFELQEDDVACRVNFATADPQGIIIDRRAGRLATDHNRELAKRIRDNLTFSFDGEWFFETVSEHRAVLVFRGKDLSGEIEDTDPQKTGLPPRSPVPRTPGAEKTAGLVRQFLEQAGHLLKKESRANTLLLRGFDQFHPFPTLQDRFRVNGLCLADYPMYRGLSRLLGMTVPPPPGGLRQGIERLRQDLREPADAHDFYFFHVKDTDSRGEDGDFPAKVQAIEQVDAFIPLIREAEPDVLVVTADHSTPAILGRHTWHPVPVLIYAHTAMRDRVNRFDEEACRQGALGLRPAYHLMGLALAHAGRLKKFGA